MDDEKTPSGPNDDQDQNDQDQSEQSEGDQSQSDRIAIGIALGLPLGVSLSIVMDNWALLGVGLVMGLTFGVVDWGNSNDDEGPGQ